MSVTRTADFIYALRIIKLLTTPWEEQEAFKHGIIDAKGNRLRRSSELKSSEERDSFTYLHRMVFNLKRVLGKAPGGNTMLAAATASLLLLKEGCASEEEWNYLKEEIEKMTERLHEDTPANVTGDAVSTRVDVPSGLAMMKRSALKDFSEFLKDKKERETKEKGE